MIATLRDLVIEACAKKLDSLLEKGRNPYKSGHAFNVGVVEIDSLQLKNIYLPSNLCEPVLQIVLKNHGSEFLKLFRDRNRCQIKTLNLSNANLKDQSILVGLFVHAIEELDLSNSVLKSDTAKKLDKLSHSLRILNLSGTGSSWKKGGATFLKSLNKLSRLDVSFASSSEQDECLKTISSLTNLEWLNLSGWHLKHISPLSNLSSSLTRLFLFDVCDSASDHGQLSAILSKMTLLTHLDISKEIDNLGESDEQKLKYLNADVIKSIAAMPNLVYLDISGCNELQRSDIDALGLTKLSFLGLFKTGHEFDSDIPVKTITGTANEEQLLAALEVYARRFMYAKTCFLFLGDLLHHDNIPSYETALQLVLVAAKEHLHSEDIQLPASFCVTLLITQIQNKGRNLSLAMQRFAISTILDIMNAQKSTTILKRLCQCLLRCILPGQFEFEGERICEMMLRILEVYTDNHLKTMAIVIFNAIICCPLVKKVHIRNFGAIRIVLNMIRTKCAASEMDHLMDTCWSVLWNIADEAPENCQCFIDNDGMELFTDCLKEFKHEEELHKVMLGLMGNIAEVKHLRHIFMKKEYIETFVNMLDYKQHDFELSYNAAGVLSHITSDGEDAWTLKTISRSQCMNAMIESISSWDITKTRQINYRSFEPILRLIPDSNTPAAQLWAVWALTNLTTVYPSKYCELLVGENGINILRGLLSSQLATETMRELAQKTLNMLRTQLGVCGSS